MYAYNAALYCDECAYKIMDALGDDCNDGTTDSYPQWCSDDSESDSPEHCDECGEFLGNSLTSDGADYVVNTVRDDLLEGRTNSIACTVWRKFYFWLDFPNYTECAECGEKRFCDCFDLCEDCDD